MYSLWLDLNQLNLPNWRWWQPLQICWLLMNRRRQMPIAMLFSISFLYCAIYLDYWGIRHFKQNWTEYVCVDCCPAIYSQVDISFLSVYTDTQVIESKAGTLQIKYIIAGAMTYFCSRKKDSSEPHCRQRKLYCTGSRVTCLF